MALHTIVGAGAVGTATATALLDEGHTVRMLTRSGSGPDRPRLEKIQADAGDADALTRAATGAAALYNCVNPPYHRWARDWPPMNAALITAAERTGAGLVTMGNLYSYGRVNAPMSEDTAERPNGVKGEVRRQMWADALAAHNAGRIRATEARASDFGGPGTAKTSYISVLIVPRVRAGKTVRMLVGDVDAPHSWTFTHDVGRTLAKLGTDDRSWGRVWHVPTNDPCSARQVATEVAELMGMPVPKVVGTPRIVVRAGGLAVPFLRELRETRHQFDHPFVLDSHRTQQTFGLFPTPWTTILAASL